MLLLLPVEFCCSQQQQQHRQCQGRSAGQALLAGSVLQPASATRNEHFEQRNGTTRSEPAQSVRLSARLFRLATGHAGRVRLLAALRPLARALASSFCTPSVYSPHCLWAGARARRLRASQVRAGPAGWMAGRRQLAADRVALLRHRGPLRRRPARQIIRRLHWWRRQ